MQTKAMSLVEAIINVGLGFLVALVVASVVFPLFGIETSPMQNLGIVSLFTLASVARAYIVRLAFNWWHHR